MAVRKYFWPWSYKTGLLVAATFLLLFGAGGSALNAPPPANALNLGFVNAIWVVKADGVLKLRGADGKLLGNILALEADPLDQSLWPAPRQTREQGADLRDVALNPDTIPPYLTFTVPTDGVQVTATTLRLTLSYSDIGVGVDASTLSIEANGNALNVTCSFEPASATCTPRTPLPLGANTVTATIKDFAGNLSAQAKVNFTWTPAVNHPPQVNAGPNQTITLPGIASLHGTVTEDGLPIPPGEVTVLWTVVSGRGTVTFDNPTALDTTASFSLADIYVLKLTANDGSLSGTAQVTITVAPATGGLPPDPSTVAPPVENGVATTIGSATAFLYTGPNPIQTGVVPGTIDPRLAAVLRGKVLDRNDAPLSGVTISVLSHPEFGQTLSRADGMFDMAVNGGGLLTVNYAKADYFHVQRHVDVPWQDFAFAPDVVLVQQDAQVTTLDLNAPVAMQVARGRKVTDTDGTRQATLFVPQGTQAQMVMPDGSTQPLTTLNVRATEFTVGPNGPKAMPAELPPTSGYTYAVDFSTDEAQTAGASRVQFARPIPVYVENFLDFPVGIEVPLGSYDKVRGAWVPSDSGRVVKILNITGGAADLDTTGSGTADNGAALGVTTAERQQLASIYRPGQTLWRISISHFSPVDCNWPFKPPSDAAPPPEGPEGPDPKPDDTCNTEGSVIECQSQVLGESIRLTGTAFSFNYRSDRVPGRKAADTLTIPLSGASVPASLKRIDLEITVAGQMFAQSFPPTANQTTTFTWDHKDAYGRTVQGPQAATVRVGYTYNGVYQGTSRFGDFGNGILITANRTRQEVTLWQTTTLPVGSFDFRTVGLGAWTLNVHHLYDVIGKVVYVGNGARRSSAGLPATITTVAGNGTLGFSGDGGPATGAALSFPFDVTLGPDGSLYIADRSNNRIRRVGPDGIITTVAGNGTSGFSGDGGPATAAALSSPSGIALGPDGSLYVADSSNNRIRRVGLDGIITTVAGTGAFGFSGDGGPATSAAVACPCGIAIGPDGSLYIATQENGRIRRAGPDGIITTVAGNGTSGFSGDGGPATAAALSYASLRVALGPDGSLYIADSGNQRIRRVGLDGIITTVAGNGTSGFSGDGGPATAATLFTPEGLALGPDGSLYISDTGNQRIRRVGADGIITTVAGNGTSGFSGDGGPATAAALSRTPFGIALGPDGSLYIADSINERIRKVVAPLPGLQLTDIVIAAADGSEVYLFNGAGRHLRTLNALTGATLYEFAYDPDGHLSNVTDGDGNGTAIEHDASGNPTAIVGPFGQRTILAADASGYLASITNPAGEAYRMAYTADGLLTTLTDPKGNASTLTYDSMGRLTRDQNARSPVLNWLAVTRSRAIRA